MTHPPFTAMLLQLMQGHWCCVPVSEQQNVEMRTALWRQQVPLQSTPTPARCNSMAALTCPWSLCRLTPPCYTPPREWPYEHIVPGIPKNSEPYRGGFQKGHKRVAVREERLQQIQKSMDKMPQLIAEYRVS
jgi:hypothetical protein